MGDEVKTTTKTMTKEDFVAAVKEQVETVVKDHNEGFQADLKTQINEAVVALKTDLTADFKQFQVGDKLQKNKSGYDSFADFAQDIFKCGPSGQSMSTKMKEYHGIIKAAGNGMAAFDSESGGYLIPDEFRTELLSVAVEKTNILQKCMKIPMMSNSIDIPYVNGFDKSGGLIHGGVQFKWMEEEEQYGETKPKIGRIGLKLKKLGGLCYATSEILEDSPISMEPLLKAAFTDALAYTLDGVFIEGSGAGQPLGILNAPALVTVAKESSQSAGTILFENIIKMYARIWRTNGAVWLANRDTLPQLATMELAVGTGGSAVFLPANGAAGRPFDTLMGLPLIFTEHAKTVGTAGDIMLTDWSQYLVGQKSTGLQFASSVHLKFDYDQTAFKFTLRIDGQPWWKQAMVPKNGVNTLSPFVTLATRA